MGLFSKLFKSSAKPVYETPQGIFSRVYSKGTSNLWSCDSGDCTKTVTGTEAEPDAEQMSFISNAENEIRLLRDAINERFIYEFTEAELDVDFTDWEERFKLIAISVETIQQGIIHWEVTFEEKESYFHYNLYIEGRQLKSFSIDT